METAKKLILAVDFIHVYRHHLLQMGRCKIKEILKNTKNNSQVYYVQ